MTVVNKRVLKGLPHIQPPPVTRPKIKDVAIAQAKHVKRAKPPTIDTPPWEKESKSND